ncbi:MAG TPA: chemotaxis response regulator protein-glutamate methylesterase [Pirellulaceae bacterium]|nr:chemotaxis response regulator protein-glutamate methylesterase [Pirellulaceae bacterium]
MKTDAKIRVMVVDDSALIRQIIVDNIAETTDLEVAGVASDGHEALAIFDQVRPDVVTLDIQMPRMDGLATLEAMLARRPVPVLMVSSQTRLGADMTLEALERGALDYVAKPDSARTATVALRDELLRKIRSIAGTDLKRVLEIRQRRAERKRERRETPLPFKSTTAFASAAPLDFSNKCIALGISTGGPPALTAVFEQLVPPLPPIVIVQHMPVHFTKQFAARLNSISRITVKEAATGDVLEPNCAYIAPGGQHLQIRKVGHAAKLFVSDGDPVSGHRPSVDVMMQSAANVFGARCLGVIMTGMGRDGAAGCAAIRAAGGFVLGQDEATSDVYGMNKVAFNEGHVDRQFGLEEAAGTLMQQVKRLWSPSLAMA